MHDIPEYKWWYEYNWRILVDSLINDTKITLYHHSLDLNKQFLAGKERPSGVYWADYARTNPV